MSKGIMELINETPQISYDPQKGITIDELEDMFVKLMDWKPRKPEYILSKYEAETLPLDIVNWLGENYIVLCSLEVSQIVKQRESTQK